MNIPAVVTALFTITTQKRESLCTELKSLEQDDVLKRLPDFATILSTYERAYDYANDFDFDPYTQPASKCARATKVFEFALSAFSRAIKSTSMARYSLKRKRSALCEKDSWTLAERLELSYRGRRLEAGLSAARLASLIAHLGFFR